MIKSCWKERTGFSLYREDIGDQYIFIHFITPVIARLKEKDVPIQAGGCVIWGLHACQKFHSPDCALVHDWFHAAPSCGALMQKYGLECERVYYPADSNEISAFISEIELEQVKQAPFYIEVSSSIGENLFARLARSLTAESPAFDTGQKEQFVKVRMRIHADYLHDWNVREMAQLANLSESRFYAVYKEIFGIPPMRDLCNTRLQRAQFLLTSTRCSVEKAAERSGYKNQYHFIRQFKQYTGMTPGQYRECGR